MGSFTTVSSQIQYKATQNQLKPDRGMVIKGSEHHEHHQHGNTRTHRSQQPGQQVHDHL